MLKRKSRGPRASFFELLAGGGAAPHPRPQTEGLPLNARGRRPAFHHGSHWRWHPGLARRWKLVDARLFGAGCGVCGDWRAGRESCGAAIIHNTAIYRPPDLATQSEPFSRGDPVLRRDGLIASALVHGLRSARHGAVHGVGAAYSPFGRTAGPNSGTTGDPTATGRSPRFTSFTPPTARLRTRSGAPLACPRSGVQSRCRQCTRCCAWKQRVACSFGLDQRSLRHDLRHVRMGCLVFHELRSGAASLGVPPRTCFSGGGACWPSRLRPKWAQALWHEAFTCP